MALSRTHDREEYNQMRQLDRGTNSNRYRPRNRHRATVADQSNAAYLLIISRRANILADVAERQGVPKSRLEFLPGGSGIVVLDPPEPPAFQIGDLVRVVVAGVQHRAQLTARRGLAWVTDYVLARGKQLLVSEADLLDWNRERFAPGAFERYFNVFTRCRLLSKLISAVIQIIAFLAILGKEEIICTTQPALQTSATNRKPANSARKSAGLRLSLRQSSVKTRAFASTSMSCELSWGKKNLSTPAKAAQVS